MDTIIELIVQGVIALFSGGKYEKNSPQSMPPSQPPPLDSQARMKALREAQRQQAVQRQQAMQRQQVPGRRQVSGQRQPPVRYQPAVRQQGLTRQPVPPRGKAFQRVGPVRQTKRGMPPPVPIVAPVPRVAPEAAVSAAKPAAPAASASTPAISAAGIRQLILTRKGAIRTIYVLSEVIGPPVALRDPR